MSAVTIVTHFSEPNWRVVNKLGAICKCLEVDMIHCSSIEKLKQTVRKPVGGRVLFFTDEGLIDSVQEFNGLGQLKQFEVAMFINSPIVKVAQKIADLHIVKYLIGVEVGESYGRDLSILIKKFSDGDILDLEKYLAFGCKINHRTVNSNKSKRESIETVAAYITRLGDPGYNHPFHEYSRRVAEFTDELLLNAIFDANPRLQNADRSKPFELSPDEEIQMSWGYDGEYFGISVRDPFGRFNSETIMKYLSTRQELSQILSAESAGLGLKFIFEKAHQVVTNVKSEKVTEVIALVKFLNRMLEFENQKKSFYFFGDSGAAKKSSI
ncbi:MAG: hypothetical protein ACXVA9_03650 [Bdellovibrionales bacterium]